MTIINPVELTQLKYFLAVAETGGFSRAAKRCYVAQPSLSQQIIKLEKELGQKLFDRLGRKVTLTEAGSALLPKAKKILQDINEAKSAVTNELNQETETLSIGILPTIAPFLLPVSLNKIQKKFPAAILNIYENLTDNLIRQLINFEIDIAIISLPIENSLISYKHLFNEPMVVSIPKNHPLSKQKYIKSKDLVNLKFIALDEENCFGEQVKNFCIEKSLSLNILCKTLNLATVQNCVAGGSGISVVPSMMALADKTGKSVYKNFSDEKPFRTVVSASYKGKSKKRLAEEYETVLMESFENLGGKIPG
ncbi:MAG: LysR family transcriptional regulator [Thermodesulfobacteriota bacterium]